MVMLSLGLSCKWLLNCESKLTKNKIESLLANKKKKSLITYYSAK